MTDEKHIHRWGIMAVDKIRICLDCKASEDFIKGEQRGKEDLTEAIIFAKEQARQEAFEEVAEFVKDNKLAMQDGSFYWQLFEALKKKEVKL